MIRGKHIPTPNFAIVCLWRADGDVKACSGDLEKLIFTQPIKKSLPFMELEFPHGPLQVYFNSVTMICAVEVV